MLKDFNSRKFLYLRINPWNSYGFIYEILIVVNSLLREIIPLSWNPVGLSDFRVHVQYLKERT